MGADGETCVGDACSVVVTRALLLETGGEEEGGGANEGEAKAEVLAAGAGNAERAEGGCVFPDVGETAEAGAEDKERKSDVLARAVSGGLLASCRRERSKYWVSRLWRNSRCDGGGSGGGVERVPGCVVDGICSERLEGSVEVSGKAEAIIGLRPRARDRDRGRGQARQRDTATRGTWLWIRPNPSGIGSQALL